MKCRGLRLPLLSGGMAHQKEQKALARAVLLKTVLLKTVLAKTVLAKIVLAKAVWQKVLRPAPTRREALVLGWVGCLSLRLDEKRLPRREKLSARPLVVLFVLPALQKGLVRWKRPGLCLQPAVFLLQELARVRRFLGQRFLFLAVLLIRHWLGYLLAKESCCPRQQYGQVSRPAPFLCAGRGWHPALASGQRVAPYRWKAGALPRRGA